MLLGTDLVHSLGSLYSVTGLALWYKVCRFLLSCFRFVCLSFVLPFPTSN